MANLKIRADALASAVSDVFNEYGDEVTKALFANVESVAAEALPKIKAESPKRPAAGAKYSKGWRKKISRDGRYAVEAVIHNKTDYQLTHLLEKGHEIVDSNGVHHGRTREIPHISAVQEWASEEVYTRTIKDFK